MLVVWLKVMFSLMEFLEAKIEKVAAILGVSEEEIYKAVESKIRPLELELQEEFQQTEESQTYRRNLKIVLEYERKKRQFNIEYMLEDNDDRYDYCYMCY